jgi:hypothetical protein
MMKCNDVQEMLADLLLGELNESTSAAIQAHLNQCRTCRAEFDALSGLWRELGALPEQIPERNLRPGFDAMLAAYKQGMQHSGSRATLLERLNGWIGTWWPGQPLVQFASAVACLVVGVMIGIFAHSAKPLSHNIVALQKEMQHMREVTAISLLRQDSPTERLHGISLGAQAAQPGDELLASLLQTLNTDPNVNVRLAAVDALYLFRNHARVRSGLIESLAGQTSPLVQIALIDLLTEIREKQSIDALKRVIEKNNLDTNVRQRAETGLKQLL